MKHIKKNNSKTSKSALFGIVQHKFDTVFYSNVIGSIKDEP